MSACSYRILFLPFFTLLVSNGQLRTEKWHYNIVMEIHGAAHSKKQLGEQEQAIYNWDHFSIHNNNAVVLPFTMHMCKLQQP